MSKKITEFNKQNLNELVSEINEALKPIAEKYGLGELRMSGGRYVSTEWTGKLKATLTSDLLASDPSLKARNKQYIEILGLPENVMDMVFTAHGKTFSVVGFNPRKPKNAISLMETNGNKLMCPVETITNLIAAKKYSIKAMATA